MTHGAAAAVVITALALAGCGGDEDKGDPIPRRDANRMVALLDLAERQSGQGTCNGARAKVREAGQIADGLPDGVDPDVRRELTSGIDRLAELVESECQVEEEPEDTTTTTVPEPTTTTPEPTATTPEPTATTPEPEPTTTTPEPEPEPTTPEPVEPGNGGTPPGQE